MEGQRKKTRNLRIVLSPVHYWMGHSAHHRAISCASTMSGKRLFTKSGVCAQNPMRPCRYFLQQLLSLPCPISSTSQRPTNPTCPVLPAPILHSSLVTVLCVRTCVRGGILMRFI